MNKTVKKSCFIYWVSLKGVHTDIKTQGYVGFTSVGVKQRWSQHKVDSRSKKYSHFPLYRAIKKYGVENLEVTTVCEGSADYCLFMENLLRNSPRVGWNTQVGGGFANLGVTQTEESKRHQSEVMKSKNLTMWKSGRTDVGLWLHAESIYDIHSKHPEFGYEKLAGIIGTRKAALQGMFASFSQGWSPYLDDEFQTFKKSNNGNSSSFVWNDEEIKKRLKIKTRKPFSWERYEADKTLWSNAHECYLSYLKQPSIGASKLGSLFGRKETQMNTMLRKFRSGWNPLQDTDWLEFKNNYKETQHGT